jgi:DNA-binding transcriptional LysR family regulator
MDMDQIRTFVAIARGRSFSRASAMLHRSQPAISRRIELLEREFDVPLFERRRGGAILTDAGEAFLPFAEAVLAAAEDGAQVLRATQKGDAARISLAIVGTLANSALTTVLQRFCRRYPNVRLDLRTATSREIGESVRRGEATLGIRYLPDRDPNLQSELIGSEKLLVVGSANHPLADGKKHRPDELSDQRWVGFPARNSRETFAGFLDGKLRSAGLEVTEIIPIDSLTAQKRLVEAGFGIALLAESGIREELSVGSLKVLNIPALRASIPIHLVYRRNGYINPAARVLLSMLAGQRKSKNQSR